MEPEPEPPRPILREKRPRKSAVQKFKSILFIYFKKTYKLRFVLESN